MTWTPESMGRKGGKKSRRTLTPEQAKKMVKKREAKRKREAILNMKLKKRLNRIGGNYDSSLLS